MRGVAGGPLSSLTHADRKRLVALLAGRAVAAPAQVGVAGYFRSLIDRTPLPTFAKNERLGGWTGSANFDAAELVRWSSAYGVNPADQKWTAFGSVLRVVLEEDVGLDAAAEIVALIDVYGLCLDAAEHERLTQRYGVPLGLAPQDVGLADEGPDIDWRGPSGDLDLQGWRKPEPPLLDVGFLTEAIRRAAAVCRVELPALARVGTGVLISSDLVITNHHVMQWDEKEDVGANAAGTTLRFGCVTAEPGRESDGQTFALAHDTPVIQTSMGLDYALLRVEPRIRDAGGVRPVAIETRSPIPGSGINILQHPLGGAMKLALSANGVTGVYADGRLQYVTNAAKGSSGAPCFDDRWQMVGLHHAQRARSFGRIGEGILMAHIGQEIAPFLQR